MSEDEQLTLWLGSFRYYCGRMSYAVGDFTELLIREWPKLPIRVKHLIERDLEEEFLRDDASREMQLMQNTDRQWFHPLGQYCDRQRWDQVRRLWRTEPEAP